VAVLSIFLSKAFDELDRFIFSRTNTSPFFFLLLLEGSEIYEYSSALTTPAPPFAFFWLKPPFDFGVSLSFFLPRRRNLKNPPNPDRK